MNEPREASADDLTDFDEDRNPVEQLADEFAQRHRKGECPSIAEYVERYPEHAEEIEVLFPSVVMMEQLKRREDAEIHMIDRKNQLEGKLLERIGDFEIVREIGRGGMGVVYEAVQESLGRRVALKVLTANAISSPKQLQRFQRESQSAARLHHTNIVPIFGVGEHDGLHYYVMQFIEGLGLDIVLQALKQWQTLEENSTVEKQLTVDGDNPSAGRSFSAFMAVEALKRDRFSQTKRSSVRLDSSFAGLSSEGATTQSLLGSAASSEGVEAKNGSALTSDVTKKYSSESPEGSGEVSSSDTSSVPEGAAINRLESGYWRSIARLGFQVAEALDYAHMEGVIHRDIKPGNLLLDPSGTVWITDFGLAKQSEYENLTNTGDIVGTLRYMAPEQFDGISDERSDLYSLGLTLYELVCLRPAFDGKHRQQLIQQVTTQPPPRPRTIRPEIPKDLETIILKATQSEPTRRYKSGADLADDLERFLDDRPILARRTSGIERAWRWAKRNPLASSASALVVVLLIGIAIISSRAYWKTNQALAKAKESHTEAVAARETAEAESNRARAEFARADKNLSIAMEALGTIFTEFSSRGIPSSFEFYDEEFEDVQSEATLTKADTRLLKGLLTFYERFSKENKENENLAGLTSAAFQRMGDLHMRLWDRKKAAEAYRQAISYCSKTIQPIRYAELYNALAKADWRVAKDALQTAEGHLKSLSEELFELDACQFQLAQTYFLMTIIPRAQRSRSTIEETRKKGFAIIEGLIDENPGNVQFALLRTKYLGSRIMIDVFFKGDASSADEVISHLNGHVTEFPNDPRFKYELVRALIYVGRFRLMEDDDTALSQLEEAVDIGRSLTTEFPSISEYSRRASHARRLLAIANIKIGNTEAALGLLQESLKDLKRRSDGSSRYQRSIYFLQTEIAIYSKRCNKPEESHYAFKEAIELMETLKGFPNEFKKAMMLSLAGLYEQMGDSAKRHETLKTAEERFADVKPVSEDALLKAASFGPGPGGPRGFGQGPGRGRGRGAGAGPRPPRPSRDGRGPGPGQGQGQEQEQGRGRGRGRGRSRSGGSRSSSSSRPSSENRQPDQNPGKPSKK